MQRLPEHRLEWRESLEMQFHGISHQHSNLFANIDRLLREHGFSLFDLEAYRYTRAVLPGHSVYEIPAQTYEGQVVWGDALYLRDVTAQGHDRRWGALEPAKLLKLACLHELLGVPDCAAELLLQRRDALRQFVDLDRALDVLANEMDAGSASYRDHNAKVERAPRSFFPDAQRRRLLLPRHPLRALGRRLRAIGRSG